MPKKDSSEIIKGLVAILQIAMTTIAGYAASEIKEMNRSIGSLNIQIATLLTEVSNQKQEINRLDQRLLNVEAKALRR